MTKIKDLLEKFNVDLKLDEKVLNYEGIMDELGLNLDNFTDYHDEKSDGDEIHVFSGVIEEDSIKFEYIINPKDSENDGLPSATYLVLDDSGNVGTFNKEIFDEDIIVVETM